MLVPLLVWVQGSVLVWAPALGPVWVQVLVWCGERTGILEDHADLHAAATRQVPHSDNGLPAGAFKSKYEPPLPPYCVDVRLICVTNWIMSKWSLARPRRLLLEEKTEVGG